MEKILKWLHKKDIIVVIKIQRDDMTRFKELLTHIHGSHVYIQTHNFPDPDAIASAFGLSALLHGYGVSASICYKGKIERYSTNDFVKKLGIHMTNLDEIRNMSAETEIILVDTQKGNSNIFDAPGDEIICIDHHPTFQENVGVVYRYADIRPWLGACATIIAGYFFENGIEMDRNVATALLYGIKTDTMGLSRGVSQEDVEIYNRLFSKSDLDIIRSLEHCSLKFEDLRAYANAINSIKVYDNISFANTGENCPEALIATISDFMLDLVEVDFTVVYSMKEDGVKFSVRSSGGLDAGRITNEALSGFGSGGGHAAMAGGFVPWKEEKKDPAVLTGRIEDCFLNVIAKYK